MHRVINGKIYDTKTASLICSISRTGFSQSDFHYEDTSLYRTDKGAFFIAGCGGARSRWAEPVGQNGFTGGGGLRLVDEAEAKSLVETHSTTDMYISLFGKPEEG